MTCHRHDILSITGHCELCDRESDARFDIVMHCANDWIAMWLVEEVTL